MSENKQEWDITEIAAKSSKWIETHFKKILAVFVVIIIASSLWAWMKSVQRQNEKDAFTELYKITKVYDETKQKFDEADQKSKTPVGEKAEKPEPTVTKTGDLEKDYPGVAAKLEAFIQENKGYNASAEAALTLSELYSDYAMAEKGAEVLTKVLGDWSKKNVVFDVMQMRSGDLLASADKCDKAIEHWQKVATKESFVKSQAQLKMGVCLQKLGRIDEAKTWFEKINSDDPNSTEGFNAKRYIRFLEFKSQNQKNDPQGKAQKTDSKQDKAS